MTEDPSLRTHAPESLIGEDPSANSGLLSLTLPSSMEDENASRVVVGRGELADISVTDLLLSRRHFELCWYNGQWHARDLNSKNGTTLNDELLNTHPQPVADGDILSAGTSSFQITVS